MENNTRMKFTFPLELGLEVERVPAQDLVPGLDLVLEWSLVEQGQVHELEEKIQKIQKMAKQSQLVKMHLNMDNMGTGSKVRIENVETGDNNSDIHIPHHLIQIVTERPVTY